MVRRWVPVGVVLCIGFVLLLLVVPLHVRAADSPFVSDATDLSGVVVYTDSTIFNAEHPDLMEESFENSNAGSGSASCAGPWDTTTNNACVSPGDLQPNAQYYGSAGEAISAHPALTITGGVNASLSSAPFYFSPFTGITVRFPHPVSAVGMVVRIEGSTDDVRVIATDAAGVTLFNDIIPNGFIGLYSATPIATLFFRPTTGVPTVPQVFLDEIRYSTPDALIVSQSVAPRPDSCYTGTTTAPSGQTGYYCYTLTNATPTTLTLHSLTDSVFGTVLTDEPYTLAPGGVLNTVAVGVELSRTIATTQTHTTTWTAEAEGGAVYTESALFTVGVSETLLYYDPTEMDGTFALTTEDFDDSNVGDGQSLGCSTPWDETGGGACFAPGALEPGVTYRRAPEEPNGLTVYGNGSDDEVRASYDARQVGQTWVFTPTSPLLEFDPPVHSFGVALRNVTNSEGVYVDLQYDDGTEQSVRADERYGYIGVYSLRPIRRAIIRTAAQWEIYPVEVGLRAVQYGEPELTVQGGVGPNATTCATTPTLEIPAATEVYYCFTVTNNTPLTVTRHSLTVEGETIFTDVPYTLAPGTSWNSFDAGYIISRTVTTSTTVLGTWVAEDGVNPAKSGSDVVTVIVRIPNIAVSPVSLDETHNAPPQVTIRPLSIHNVGAGTLHWLLTEGAPTCDTPADVPWLSTKVTGGSVPAGNTETVMVTFDSTGLEGGTYEARLCIASDDPDTPLSQVLVHLTVRTPATATPTPTVTGTPSPIPPTATGTPPNIPPTATGTPPLVPPTATVTGTPPTATPPASLTPTRTPTPTATPSRTRYLYLPLMQR